MQPGQLADALEGLVSEAIPDQVELPQLAETRPELDGLQVVVLEVEGLQLVDAREALGVHRRQGHVI